MNPQTPKKTGILLLNLGGPGEPSDVTPFLFNLFSDEDILVGIPAVLRIPLALLIASLKGGSSVKNYGGSGSFGAQLHWTREQACSLAGRLPSHPVEIGMRAWHPFIEEGLLNLRRQGVERILLLPLFPQFSTTTTGSCFREVARVLARWGWNPEIQALRTWAVFPPYIQALRARAREAVAKARISMPGEEPHVLFSAHSLPMSVVKRGDPYPEETRETLEAVVAGGLGAPYSLSFQSRNGKAKWIEPYTEDKIPELAKEGVRNLVLVPMSFVSDHIETLHELDQLYTELAEKSGIRNISRSRSFNADPDFIDVLASLAKEALDNTPVETDFYRKTARG